MEVLDARADIAPRLVEGPGLIGYSDRERGGGVVGGVVVDRSGSWQKFSDTPIAPEPMRRRLRAAGGVERDE